MNGHGFSGHESSVTQSYAPEPVPLPTDRPSPFFASEFPCPGGLL
jgi:hypothetical protein